MDACSLTVLVVEDEGLVRMVLVHDLAELGFRSLVARDGHEALMIAARTERRIDILLSDVVLPDMTGCTLARRLEITRPDLAVVLMSGYPAEFLTRQGRVPPGTPVLQKPFDPGTLAATIQAASITRAH